MKVLRRVALTAALCLPAASIAADEEQAPLPGSQADALIGEFRTLSENILGNEAVMQDGLVDVEPASAPEARPSADRLDVLEKRLDRLAATVEQAATATDVLRDDLEARIAALVDQLEGMPSGAAPDLNADFSASLLETLLETQGRLARLEQTQAGTAGAGEDDAALRMDALEQRLAMLEQTAGEGGDGSVPSARHARLLDALCPPGQRPEDCATRLLQSGRGNAPASGNTSEPDTGRPELDFLAEAIAGHLQTVRDADDRARLVTRPLSNDAAVPLPMPKPGRNARLEEAWGFPGGPNAVYRAGKLGRLLDRLPSASQCSAVGLWLDTRPEDCNISAVFTRALDGNPLLCAYTGSAGWRTRALRPGEIACVVTDGATN